MEVKYLIDGIPVNDPIGRGFGVHISTNALEQIEVITGGFNAEHGTRNPVSLISSQRLEHKTFPVESGTELGSG